MKCILLIDSTSQTCQVALTCPSGFYLEQIEGARLHTENIIPLISQLFQKSGLKFEALDAVAVTQGPGSFTGVRVGFCIAQGLAYGWNIPLIPLPTLQVLAQSAFKETQDNKSESDSDTAPHYYTLMDARMHELYVGHYRIAGTHHTLLATQMDEDCLLTPEAFVQRVMTENNKICLYGDGLEAYQDILAPLYNQAKIKIIDPKILPYLNLKAMATLALNGKGCPPLEVSPIYVRNQVTHVKPPE